MNLNKEQSLCHLSLRRGILFFFKDSTRSLLISAYPLFIKPVAVTTDDPLATIITNTSISMKKCIKKLIIGHQIFP